MPNWTFNELTIIGDTKTLSKFKDALRSKTSDEPLDAENVIPYDGILSLEAMRELVQLNMNVASIIHGDNEDGLSKVKWPKPDEVDWQHYRWGTKWGFCYSKLRYKDENCLVYIFDSAWCTPYKLMNELYRQWPSLTFEYRYFSPESGFEGYEIAMSGKIIENEDCDLLYDDDGNPIFRILPSNIMDDDRFDDWVSLKIDTEQGIVVSSPARVKS